MVSTFSILMHAERGFPQEDIIDWVDRALNLLCLHNSYQTLAVSYSTTVELVYGKINIFNSEDINERKIREFLVSAPQGIEVINFSEMKNKYAPLTYSHSPDSDVCSA